MKNKSVVMCLVGCSMLLGVAACSSSEPGAPAAMQAPAAGGGAVGAGMSADTRACAKITMDATLSNNNCNNAADKCFLLEHAAEIRTLGGQCATKPSVMVNATMIPGCMQYIFKPTDPAATQCFNDCMDKALKAKFNASVSPPCLICPNAVVRCSTSNEPSKSSTQACLTECVSDPDSAGCTSCLCAQHPNGVAMDKPGSCLIGAYADCTGFRPTPEQVSCPAGSQ